MKKINLAIILYIGILISNPVNAQLYQCRPITCDPGKYFNMANKQCEDCSADEYCLCCSTATRSVTPPDRRFAVSATLVAMSVAL